MRESERFSKLIRRRPHAHPGLFQRPHLSRRGFLRTAAGLGASFLAGAPAAGEPIRTASAQPRNTAKNVVLIFLHGGPSHVDTFDFKMIDGVTPTDFEPEVVAGRLFPAGLMPHTARVLGRTAVIRSGTAWALAHSLAQTWVQIGRDPASLTGRIAPHIGSVVALEKEPERRPDQVFPAFLSLMPADTAGPGYFPQQYAALETSPKPSGLANITHFDGRERFAARWDLLQRLDGGLRGESSPIGAPVSGFSAMYEDARGLMYNPLVEQAFTFGPEDSLRYGSSPFGDSCLIAKQVLAADQGTRFIQVTLTGWDHHSDIYVPHRDYSIYSQARQFDAAFAALIEDLDATGLLDETLVVAAGEFGRTVGGLSNVLQGRDHYRQMFYVFAGGGVVGGKVIGETDPTGSFTADPGWSRFREIRPEDIEATIYSALGIDWTTVRRDDPLGRGFPYVPLAEDEVYAPVDELWQA